MIIGVKYKNNLDGTFKGSEYSYECDIDVVEGDIVVAPTKGGEVVAQVTRLNVEPLEAAGYELKTITQKVEDHEVGGELKDIEIKELALPVIKINFDEVKTALSDALNKYKNIVVTEQTLPGCKMTQKELAGQRRKIDAYRIEKAKELAVPIKKFEDECRQLIALIESVETPIKEGIKVFDDQKKNKQRDAALRLIKEVAESTGLNEKYAMRLTVTDQYCNLTAKESDVKKDLEQRAFALKVEQDRENELIEIIESTIEVENERLGKKLTFADFSRLISAGASTKDVLAEIKAQADRIYEAENKPKESPVTVTVLPDSKEYPPIEITPAAPVELEYFYYARYKITGTAEQLKSVSAFLKENRIPYTVEEQGAL